MQTKIRFGISDLDYVGIDYFRSKSWRGFPDQCRVYYIEFIVLFHFHAQYLNLIFALDIFISKEFD